MAVIITEQAPSAKPISVVSTLSDTYQDIITVDSYEVPVTGFAAETRVAPGVVEITSALTVSNTTENAESFDVQMVRDNSSFTIANGVRVEPNEIVYIPLNGQFLKSPTDDKLQVRASTGGTLTLLISFTQGQAEEDSPFVT
jgi:hypothetical protein